MERPARQYCAAEACSSDAQHVQHHYAHAHMVCQLNRLDTGHSQLVIITDSKCPYTAIRSMHDVRTVTMQHGWNGVKYTQHHIQDSGSAC